MIRHIETKKPLSISTNLVSDCETEGRASTLWLMAHSLPLLEVCCSLDDVSLLVPIQVVPGLLHTLKTAVHGEASVDAVKIMPEISRGDTTVTPVSNSSQYPVHFLIAS